METAQNSNSRVIIEHYIEEKSLPLALAERLRGLSEGDAGAFSRVLSSLSPSASLCRVLFELCSETAKKEGIGFKELLESVSFDEILAQERISRQERLEMLRSRLSRVRFPQKAKIEDRLSTLREQLLRECGLKVELPKNLEGDVVTVTIRARSPESFLELSEKLQSLSKNPALKEIYQILLGDY